MEEENKQYASILEIYEARALLIKSLIKLKQNNYKKEDLLKDIKYIYKDIENDSKWINENEKEDVVKKYYSKPEFFKENNEEYEKIYKRAKESHNWDLLDIIWDNKCKNFIEAFDILVCFIFFIINFNRIHIKMHNIKKEKEKLQHNLLGDQKKNIMKEKIL